jgi:hypothetical protein
MDVGFFFLTSGELVLTVEVRIHTYRMPIKKREDVFDRRNKTSEGSNVFKDTAKFFPAARLLLQTRETPNGGQAICGTLFFKIKKSYLYTYKILEFWMYNSSSFYV